MWRDRERNGRLEREKKGSEEGEGKCKGGKRDRGRKRKGARNETGIEGGEEGIMNVKEKEIRKGSE